MQLSFGYWPLLVGPEKEAFIYDGVGGTAMVEHGITILAQILVEGKCKICHQEITSPDDWFHAYRHFPLKRQGGDLVEYLCTCFPCTVQSVDEPKEGTKITHLLSIAKGNSCFSLGSTAQPSADDWESYQHFQQKVVEILGQEFSTQQVCQEAGCGRAMFTLKVTELLESSEVGKVVLKHEGGTGSGDTVKFATSVEEALKAVKFGLSLPQKTLIEPFFSHTVSPCATYWIGGSEDFSCCSFTHQLLDGPKFFGSTNCNAYLAELREKVLHLTDQLVSQASREGCRGFIGIDVVCDREGNGLRFIEANYRPTASVISCLAVFRASGLLNTPWVSITVYYSRLLPNFQAALKILKESQCLFLGQSTLERGMILCIPCWEVPGSLFDLAFYWQGEVSDLIVKRITDILQSLHQTSCVTVQSLCQ